MIDRNIRSANGATGAVLVARTALAARQWETYYFAAEGAERAAAVTPRLSSYRAWLAATWRANLADDDPRALLTPQQSAALWRTVIEASPAAARMLEVRHAARWAAHAHGLLTDWRLGAVDVENADASADARALLAWQRSYLERLEEFGWLDESSLPREVARHTAPQALVLLDFGEPTKAENGLFGLLKGRGCAIETRLPPQVECVARQVGLRDSSAELEHAIAWAGTRLEQNPHVRLALIVPELASEPAAVLQRVRRALGTFFADSAAEFPAIGSVAGEPLDAVPPLGAALSALELATPRATFATLSRWLRSPFFHSGEGQTQGHAATAEAALRSDLGAALPFLTAYEQAGWARRLAALVPDLAERLRAGLHELRAPRPAATPAVWARAWSRGLALLGWPAASAELDAAALRAWEKTLTAFVELTPILGPCSQETALAELRASAEVPQREALPLHGLHVLARADEVGPGYDGVWVTGVTDRSWPEPTRLNPLLPPLLQIRHGMPWATPADSLARARATLASLRLRTRELVLSWPRVVHDYHALPSPLLAGIAAADALELALAPRAVGAPARRTLVSIADPAPAFQAAKIPGGASTLDLQARCPIRAFCETRLEARALRSPTLGLSPRAQGIAAHRALELLARAQPSDEGARSPPARPAIAASIDRALAEVFGPARSALETLFELEEARLRRLLERFVEAELRRPPFRTVGVEQRAEIRVGDVAIACRLDRLDELADGTLALIDYKSGASRTKSPWLDERLASTQLPLYALEIGSRLAALLTIELGGEPIAYRGAARQPSLIADSLRAVPDAESWAAMVERWRAQIRALVEDYVAGDVRIYAEDWSDAAGEQAPLTRVYAHTLRAARADP